MPEISRLKHTTQIYNQTVCSLITRHAREEIPFSHPSGPLEKLSSDSLESHLSSSPFLWDYWPTATFSGYLSAGPFQPLDLKDLWFSSGIRSAGNQGKSNPVWLAITSLTTTPELRGVNQWFIPAHNFVTWLVSAVQFFCSMLYNWGHSWLHSTEDFPGTGVFKVLFILQVSRTTVQSSLDFCPAGQLDSKRRWVRAPVILQPQLRNCRTLLVIHTIDQDKLQGQLMFKGPDFTFWCERSIHIAR